MKTHYLSRVLSDSPSRRLPTALFLAVAAMSVPSLAADFYWEGDDNGFRDANFWTGGVVPGMFDDIANTSDNVFHRTNGILNATGDWSVNQILAGYVSTGLGDTGTAIIKQTTGNVFVNGYLRLGELAGSSATYDISGGTLTLRGSNTDGPLQVGYNGNGTLNISGNAVINVGYGTNGWSPSIRVGDYNASGNITAHDGQKGVVNQDGGTVNTGRLLIGQSGGNGEYNLKSGTINTSSWLTIGGYGDSNGKFVMTGGEINIGTNLIYNVPAHADLWSNPGGATNGDVLIPPNTITKNGTYFMVGSVNRANGWTEGSVPVGKFEMSGGKVLLQGDALIGNGESNSGTRSGATGTFEMSGTAEFVTLGSFYLGRKSGTGTLNMDGGTLTIANHFFAGSSDPSANRVPNGGNNRNGTIATTGTINHSAGTINIRGETKLGDSTTGESVAAVGVYNLGVQGKAGTPALNVGHYMFLGLNGNGTLNVRENGTLTVRGTMR